MMRTRWLLAVCLSTLCACEEEYHPPPPPAVPPGPPPKTTVYATPPAPPPPPVQKPPVRFLEVRGHVTMDHMPVSDPVAITDNAALATGPDGTAIFTMMPGSAMLMRPNTTLELGHTAHGIDVKLHAGALWSLIPQDGVYQVSTPTGTAVSQASAAQFYVHLDKRKNLEMCTCHGDVLMTTPDNHTFNKVISAPHYDHEAVRFQRKGRKIVAKKVMQMAHTDEGNDDLVQQAQATLKK